MLPIRSVITSSRYSTYMPTLDSKTLQAWLAASEDAKAAVVRLDDHMKLSLAMLDMQEHDPSKM